MADQTKYDEIHEWVKKHRNYLISKMVCPICVTDKMERQLSFHTKFTEGDSNSLELYLLKKEINYPTEVYASLKTKSHLGIDGDDPVMRSKTYCTNNGCKFIETIGWEI